MTAKRYDHKALSEAIRQGQARMKRLMQESHAGQEIPEPQIPKHPDRPISAVPIRPMRAEREKPFHLNQGTFVIAAVFVLVIAFIVWVNRSKERLESKPPVSEKTISSVEPTVAKPLTPSPSPAKPVQPAVPPQVSQTPKPAPSTPSVPAPVSKPVQPVQEPSKPAGPEKDHIIVIATYTNRDHLVPVQAYFEANGIPTEIMRRGSYFLLVTKERFESPLRPGTDGRQMLNKIKSVGAQYKAPDGYESFGRTPFQDAYGMKVKTN